MNRKKSGAQSGEYFTKLHNAQDKKKVLHYLGKDKVDADALDENGNTPIHAYIKRGDKRKLECLMAFLINAKYEGINAKNHDGDTPLHLACKSGDVASAKALIVFDADINQFDNSNRTPYDIALETSRPLSDILFNIGAKTSYDIMGGSSALREEEEEEDGVDEVDSHAKGFRPKLTLNVSQRHPIGGGGGGDRRLDDDDHEEDKMPSIPEDDFKTPDPSIVDKPITSFFSVNSVVDEAKIIRETPFLINKDHSTAKAIPLSTTSTVSKSPLSRSPISISPLSRSPVSKSPLSTSPVSKSPLSRSPVSKSPISRSPRGRSPVNLLQGGNEDSDEMRLLEMAKRYNQIYFENPEVELSREDDDEERASDREEEEVKEAGVNVEGKGVNGSDRGDDKVSNEVSKKKEFVDYTEGEFFERLEIKASEVMLEGVEDSLGDESYAAWLQYREVQRCKKETEALKEEEIDGQVKFKVPDNHHERGNVPPPPRWDTSKPPAQKRQVTYLLPPSRHRDHRSPEQDPECSIMKSISRFRPNMAVTESILGRSTVPLRKIKKKTKGRGHRILCLDGGGVKGLIQIEVLRTIEKLAGGVPITELFDWIIGTSTGGIVTLGVVYGNQTLKDLRKIYFEMKDTVFQSQSKLLSTSCDTEALESLLKRFLGTEDTMEKENKPKVMITAVDKSSTRLPLVLFNNCFNDEFSTQLVWKVARYTSAAPVFFKECDGYIDGGVLANNPSLEALSRIQKYLREAKKNQNNDKETDLNTNIACLVSVGCGIFPPEPIGNTDLVSAIHPTKLAKLPAKIKDTLNMLTSALTKSDDVANTCHNFCEEMEIPFYRFSPKVGEEIGTAERDASKLCESIMCTKAMLHHDQGHLEDLMGHLGCKPIHHRTIN